MSYGGIVRLAEGSLDRLHYGRRGLRAGRGMRGRGVKG